MESAIHEREDRTEFTRGIMTIIHGIHDCPMIGHWARNAYFRAGAGTALYPDARDLLDLVRHPRIDLRLLTANIRSFGVGVLSRQSTGRMSPPVSSILPRRLTAWAPDSYAGHDKPLTIIKWLLKVPFAPIIVLDDNDWRLGESIGCGSAVHDAGVDIDLVEQMVFVARQVFDNSSRDSQIAAELQQRDVPFVLEETPEAGTGGNGLARSIVLLRSII